MQAVYSAVLPTPDGIFCKVFLWYKNRCQLGPSHSVHPRIFWLERAKELLNNGVIDRRADQVNVARGQGWSTDC